MILRVLGVLGLRFRICFLSGCRASERCSVDSRRSLELCCAFQGL